MPLAFGMFVLVVPQAYAELRFKGEIAPGSSPSGRDYVGFEDFSIITPTWNHLWYVAYMLVYTLLAAACLPPSALADGSGERLFAWLARRPWRLLLVPALPFAGLSPCARPAVSRPRTLLVDDWANIAHRSRSSARLPGSEESGFLARRRPGASGRRRCRSALGWRCLRRGSTGETVRATSMR